MTDDAQIIRKLWDHIVLTAVRGQCRVVNLTDVYRDEAQSCGRFDVEWEGLTIARDDPTPKRLSLLALFFEDLVEFSADMSGQEITINGRRVHIDFDDDSSALRLSYQAA